eukprot:3661518-Amphidinium_carterae.1
MPYGSSLKPKAQGSRTRNRAGAHAGVIVRVQQSSVLSQPLVYILLARRILNPFPDALCDV